MSIELIEALKLVEDDFGLCKAARIRIQELEYLVDLYESDYNQKVVDEKMIRNQILKELKHDESAS